LMAALVMIDASIASAWCFPDEQTDYTRAILHDSGHCSTAALGV